MITNDKGIVELKHFILREVCRLAWENRLTQDETEKIVYSVYDGTVINSYWNDVTENVIMIQHGNNLVSVYKHTGKLLKKTGDKVTAGTPIAVVSDVATNGAHLYLELWYEGRPIDPADYIKF